MDGWVLRQRPMALEASQRAAVALMLLETWPSWMAGHTVVFAESVGRPEAGMDLEVHRVILGAPVVERWSVTEVRQGSSPDFSEVTLRLAGQSRGTVPVGRAFDGLLLRLTVLAEADGGLEAAVKWQPHGLHRLLGRRLRADVLRLMARWLDDLASAAEA
jgi:hypothetical protein